MANPFPLGGEKETVRPEPENLLYVRSATLMLGLVATLSGCSGSKLEPWEKAIPTKGVLHLDGKPIGGAEITLVSTDPQVPSRVAPRARTKDDGSFELGTFKAADGAPVGSYKVVASWSPLVGDKDSPVRGPNQLPQRYSSPATTDIKVDVVPPATELPPINIPSR